MRRQKESNEAFSDIPEISSEFRSSVYFELEGNDEDGLEEAVFASAELMAEAGGSEEDTWIAERDEEIERFKFFRHALPEAVNMQIDAYRKEEPSLTKLGTDMAVPDEALRDMVTVYRDGVKREGLDALIFGHIGDNHLHVNILPRSRKEYERGKALYREWAQAAAEFGGSISAEHGVGKLKKELLGIMFSAEELKGMREIKRCFDPSGILNRGTLFSGG
jgi:D-lactate dehydrogenase (cytochrome)